MRIEIVSTGDEVITGSIDDTNASFISHELSECGLEVHRRHTTGDNLNEIEAVFTEISQRESVVIVTGGLGPTNDDLTTLAVSHVANVPLILHTEWLEHIKALFQRRGRVMTESNTKQAMLPQGCQIIDNPNGTACGFALNIGYAFFIFAPGVPRELKAMWQNDIKQLVLSKLPTRELPSMATRSCMLMGIGESNLSDILKHLTLPQGIIFGDRAAHPFIELKLVGRNVDPFVLDKSHNIISWLLARYTVCKGEYDPASLLIRLKIELPHFHVLDYATQGQLAFELQKLKFNISSATHFNTPLDQNAQCDLSAQNIMSFTNQLTNQTPQENTIYLMPSCLYEYWYGKTFHKLHKDGSAVFSYTLAFSLNCNIEGEACKIQGAIRFNFTPAKTEYFQSQRHRNFLTTLSITQLLKCITLDNILAPDDCEVDILEFNDGTGSLHTLGGQQYSDIEHSLQIAAEQLNALNQETK